MAKREIPTWRSWEVPVLQSRNKNATAETIITVRAATSLSARQQVQHQGYHVVGEPRLALGPPK
jgi:hypothetical protein